MRQRLHQTFFAAFLVAAAVWVVWIFYFFGKMAYEIFSIPVLPNPTLDFIAKNLLIFALLGNVDKMVDFVLGLRSRFLVQLAGFGGLTIGYFLICFYFYVAVQVMAALFIYLRGMISG